MYRAKSSDVWFNLGGVVAAYQAISAPDAISARQNVASNFARLGQHTAAPGTAPSWNPVTGWMGDGTTQYLSTGIVIPMPVDYTMLVRVSGVVSDSGRADVIGAGWFNVRPNWFAGRSYRNGNVTGTYSLMGAGNVVTSGVMGVTKSGAWLNGRLESAITSDNVADATQWTIKLLADKSFFLKGNLLVAAIYSRTLTAAEIWQASQQMKYCEVNPDWSAWSRRRKWFIVSQAGFQAAWAARANNLIGGGIDV